MQPDEQRIDASSAVDKAIDLLLHLHAQREGKGVTEVSRAVGIPKSSAHRLLATLTRRGLVERDQNGRYQPGVGLIALGLGVCDREPVVRVARPVLENEAQALGETVFLTSARAGSIIVLDKAEGTGFLRASPRIGSTVPVHVTAVGRLYLAFAPEAVLPHVPVSEAQRIQQVQARGWAENLGEWIPGLSVVAAPVWVGDRMLAALAAAAPTERMESLGRERVARQMVAAARRVGGRLGGVPEPARVDGAMGAR